MVSNIAKDLSLPRHLLEGLHAEKLRREIHAAVIPTSETPDIAQETTISLVTTEKVDLAISIHTMIGDVAIALLAVTTTVRIEMTTLMATGISTLVTRGKETITQINTMIRTMIAIPGEMETTICFLITKEIILIIRVLMTTSDVIKTMVTTTDLVVWQTTTRDNQSNSYDQRREESNQLPRDRYRNDDHQVDVQQGNIGQESQNDPRQEENSIHQSFVEPLHDLIANCDKHRKIVWTPETIAAFNEMKLQVSRCSTMHFMSDTAPITLCSDASDYGIYSKQLKESTNLLHLQGILQVSLNYFGLFILFLYVFTVTPA